MNKPNTSFLNEKQLKLLEFVKEKHGDQKRKYTGEPYWYHLVNVATIVHSEPNFATEIALCHDLFEDTTCTIPKLKEVLKSVVPNYLPAIDNIVFHVLELTDVYTSADYPKLKRLYRKRLEAKRLHGATGTAQTVKYADLIDNTKSIVEHDKGFAKTYLKEKKEILKGMNKGGFDLYLRACYELQKALLELK